MKKKILFLTTLATTGLFITVNAQKITKKIEEIKGLQPQYIAFDAKDAPSFINGSIVIQGANNKVTRQNNTLFLQSLSDEMGYTHYRYQQTLNGVPVEDAVYVLHVKSGKVLAQNGRWIKDVPQTLAGAASLREPTALKNALQSVNAKIYKWDDASEEALLKQERNNPSATYFPKGKLVYFSDNDELTPQNLRLAYKFDVYATEPLAHKYVYVDAVNGKILGTKDLIHTTDGTAVTAYSGVRTIQTTKVGTNYTLQEATRGLGIGTYNLKKTKNYSTAANFTDADNYWNNVNANKDEYATDAHWGAEMTYDFYKTVFNRNSIDGNGFAIKSYVHYSTNYFNAFWDGQRMTYGDGDASDGNRPLTALDVCGHEITHGLTTFTANLNYKNESGALNEGFSDCFGTAIEFFARPTQADWLIGGDFYTIRSMSNPNAYSQPDTYKGKYWAKGLAAWLDNGGVHTNSGVLNFWFYLLSVGGSGVNDNNVSYSVSALGIEKARAIAYRTLTTYLVPTSIYTDARTYSVAAATDLYGAGSNEVAQVNNAWNAVGVSASAAFAPEGTDLPITKANSIISVPVNVMRQYPNPVKNQFIIEFTNNKTVSTSIDLFNMSGAKVYQKKITANQGLNTINISLPQLSAGSYIVKMNNEKVSTIQIVK